MTTTQPGRFSRRDRRGGRVLIVIVATVTTLIALAFLLNDIVRIVYTVEGGYDLVVGLGSPQGVEAPIPGGNDQSTLYYWTVLLSTYEDLQLPKLLQALAIGLTTLTFLSAAVVILLLCRRLWTGRTFSVAAASGMLILAGFSLLTAWLAPWLRHSADTIALDQLGYATSGDEQWVELHRYDIGSVDSALLVLGAVLALTGLVYLGARRMQRDTEGLV